MPWNPTSRSTFNWDILESKVSLTDMSSINFTVVADDDHAISANDDQSGSSKIAGQVQQQIERASVGIM